MGGSRPLARGEASGSLAGRALHPPLAPFAWVGKWVGRGRLLGGGVPITGGLAAHGVCKFPRLDTLAGLNMRRFRVRESWQNFYFVVYSR